ncbi:hypothetical protein D9758_016484 [Tetrapyrgos nigripes]|uniref:DUF6534 domain-containing protein n=1 Tax=Tetrapyrgos nigripes TaxID=182062 RepID=A0A8H5CP90_9AGAR|nr:hypothetical protein D9758_016484 [Tetrapyrgos nigripes]
MVYPKTSNYSSRFQTLSTLLHRPEHSTKREAAFEAVVLFGFCDTSAIDFCLTLALFYALRRSGRMFGWTDSNFMALASYMINTGFLARCYLLMKYNLVYQALRNFSTEFYAVSFLAMVNAPYYFDTLHEERTRSLYIERDTSHTRSTSFHSGSHQTTSATQDFEMNTPTRKTINEVGLPLFNRSSSSPPHTIQQSVLEVNMIREQRRAIESIYTSRH